MDAIKLNSDEYITQAIQTLPNTAVLLEQQDKFIVSMKIAMKSFIYGRKWQLYLAIAILPLAIALISGNRLLDDENNPQNAPEAFVGFYFGFCFLILFGFGALLISQPLSADEISDNVVDLYLVRPIRRETYWLSRWIVSNLAIFFVNALIATIYYIYVHLVDESTKFSTEFVENLDLLFFMLVFIAAATLTYGGLFLFVGFIGDRGFTLGIILALFEQFFLSLLFLADNRWIPRTNLTKIADRVLGDYLNYNEDYGNLPGSLSYFESWLYVIGFALIFLVVGATYLRRREFH
ncbi:MAG: hypothetical protein ACXAB7_06505 [Candidatus Kariarchaeaceae archaeon]|jgi:hypothetical protein